MGLVLAVALCAPAGATPVWIAGRVELPPGTTAARVSLFPTGSFADEVRLRLAGEAATPLSSSKVRADGSYELAAPEVGLYRAVVEAGGCVAMQQTFVATDDSELPVVRLQPDRPLEVTVLATDGQPAPGVDLDFGEP